MRALNALREGISIKSGGDGGVDAFLAKQVVKIVHACDKSTDSRLDEPEYGDFSEEDTGFTDSRIDRSLDRKRTERLLCPQRIDMQPRKWSESMCCLQKRLTTSLEGMRIGDWNRGAKTSNDEVTQSLSATAKTNSRIWVARAGDARSRGAAGPVASTLVSAPLQGSPRPLFLFADSITFVHRLLAHPIALFFSRRLVSLGPSVFCYCVALFHPMIAASG